MTEGAVVNTLERQFGKHHVRPSPEICVLLVPYNSLSELRYEQGMYIEAETLLRRALEVGEKVLGADNLEVATTLNSLGLVDGARGQFAEAEPLYRRSLAIVENALGGEHPEVALRLSNLAELHKRAGPLYGSRTAIPASAGNL